MINIIEWWYQQGFIFFISKDVWRISGILGATGETFQQVGQLINSLTTDRNSLK